MAHVALFLDYYREAFRPNPFLAIHRQSSIEDKTASFVRFRKTSLDHYSKHFIG